MVGHWLFVMTSARSVRVLSIVVCWRGGTPTSAARRVGRHIVPLLVLSVLVCWWGSAYASASSAGCFSSFTAEVAASLY